MARSAICLVTGFSWFFLRYYVGVPFVVMVAGLVGAVLVWIVGYPLGLLVGHYVSRDTDVDATAYRVVAGVNLVAWALPVVGMMLSAVTMQFSRRSDSFPTLYWWLAAIGAWGALANAGIGGAHSMWATRLVERAGFDPSSEDSTSGCYDAAPADWTKEQVDNYCLHGIGRSSH